VILSTLSGCIVAFSAYCPVAYLVLRAANANLYVDISGDRSSLTVLAFDAPVLTSVEPAAGTVPLLLGVFVVISRP
jgi:hypothetical protein